MKKITELTELEILALTNEEVQLIIKLRKAEEGVILLQKPTVPDYFPIKEPDMTVYACPLFRESLTFENIEEMNRVIALIRASDSKFCLGYDYNKTSADAKFASKDIKGDYSSEKWDNVTSKRVYSLGLYAEVCDFIAQNKVMKDAYELAYKEYESVINDSMWIEDEVNDAVNAIRAKYDRLNYLCYMFKTEYLPLSSDSESVAMKFMDKAYHLTDEQSAYVLENYKK